MANDEFRRQQALNDYLEDGPQRSVNALWLRYVQMGRDDPDGAKGLRQKIATTNKTTIYEWAKLDNWREKALAYDAQRSEESRKQLEQTRKNAIDDLTTLLPGAVDALRDIIVTGDTTNRLKAVEAVLDRLGLVRMSVTEMAKLRREAEDSARPDSTMEMPGPDADDAEWSRWLAEVSRNG